MARYAAEDDEWDDVDDAEEEAAQFEDDDEDAETTLCPHCHETIYEDSERCPHCEQYISEEDAPPARKPLWIVCGMILSFVVIYLLIRYC